LPLLLQLLREIRYDILNYKQQQLNHETAKLEMAQPKKLVIFFLLTVNNEGRPTSHKRSNE
jgi:hypothetical protein